MRKPSSFNPSSRKSIRMENSITNKRSLKWLTSSTSKWLSSTRIHSPTLSKCRLSRLPINISVSSMPSNPKMQRPSYKSTPCSQKNTRTSRRNSRPSMMKLQFKSRINAKKSSKISRITMRILKNKWMRSKHNSSTRTANTSSNQKQKSCRRITPTLWSKSKKKRN